MDDSLEHAVAKAKQGDRDALDAVVRGIQGDVYGLALRFLWHPQDAEDATQEILIRIVTGLASFRGDSAFRTWAYRVACNALAGFRAGRQEQRPISFQAFGEDLANGLADEARTAEDALLLEEVKIGCTLAMLLCLDRAHRLAYIVGEIMELEHRQAAQVLETSPAAFRKRLQRARAEITGFMQAHCGLADPANACRCAKRVGTAVARGRVDPSRLLFASSLEQARRFPGVLEEIRALEETRRAAALYRSHPQAHPSREFATWLRERLAPGAG